MALTPGLRRATEYGPGITRGSDMMMLTLTLLTTMFAIQGTEDMSALNEAAAVRHTTDEGQRWLEAVRTVLDEKLSAVDRRRLGRKVLSESRVRFATGSFPQGGQTIVTVSVPLTMRDPEATPMWISGVFTLGPDEELVSVIVPLRMQHMRYDLESMGDVDGDGRDDLLFDVTDAEGTTQHLVTWTGDAPFDRVIAHNVDEGC
jgi:hypothetical protein